MPFQIVAADIILTQDFPEPEWVVPGLLPVGMTYLAGKPKIGKSWLALQLAQAVASGGIFLGQRVEPGRVLYLALEDSPRRLKKRMAGQGWPCGLPVDFVGPASYRETGGAKELREAIRNGGYRLVVVDTFARAFPTVDPNDNRQVTDALAPLQEQAQAAGNGLLVLDHHNKTASGDVIRDLLGSTAKGGVADTIAGLYKKKGERGAKLTVVGRDGDDQTLDLIFDRQTTCWQRADNPNLTPQRAEIVTLLHTLGQATLAEITTKLGRDNSGNVWRQLAELEEDGLILHDGSLWSPA